MTAQFYMDAIAFAQHTQNLIREISKRIGPSQTSILIRNSLTPNQLLLCLPRPDSPQALHWLQWNLLPKVTICRRCPR